MHILHSMCNRTQRGRRKQIIINVGIVDNDALLLILMEPLIQSCDEHLRVIWKTTNPDTAITRCLDPTTQPNVLLLDMSMEHSTGPRICRLVRERTDKVPILGMTSYEPATYATALARAGAQGLTSKVPIPALITAVRAVAQGKTYYTGQHAPFRTAMQAHRILQTKTSPSNGPLSARESEIMDLILEGRSSEEIAKILQCSATTVRTHISHAKAKLGTSGLGQTAARWMRIKEQL